MNIDRNLDNCVFCDWKPPTQLDIFAEDDLAFAMWDAYPHAPGHALVIPKEHHENLFEVSDEEIVAIMGLSRVAREEIDRRYNQSLSYNIFSNSGKEAGQVVMHAHLHIVPRYQGDHPIILGDPNKPDKDEAL